MTRIVPGSAVESSFGTGEAGTPAKRVVALPMKGALSPSNCRCSKGFTLVELLIVVLLIGIFVTFASVNWNIAVPKGEESILEKFSIRVSLLREEAVSNYESRLIQYDISEGTIRTGRMDEKTGFVESGALEIPEDYRVKDVIINGRSCSTGKCYMTLHPSGMVDRTIVHFEGKERFYTLLVNPLTARITGENGYIEETSVRGRNNPS